MFAVDPGFLKNVFLQNKIIIIKKSIFGFDRLARK